MMPVTIEWILIFLFMVIILVLFVAYSRLRGEIERRALKLFEKWKERELERCAYEKAMVLLNEWKLREEERIREDAIRRSAATIIGKVG